MEGELLAGCAHRNVCRLFGAASRAPDYCLVMEFCAGMLLKWEGEREESERRERENERRKCGPFFLPFLLSISSPQSLLPLSLPLTSMYIYRWVAVTHAAELPPRSHRNYGLGHPGGEMREREIERLRLRERERERERVCVCVCVGGRERIFSPCG